MKLTQKIGLLIIIIGIIVASFGLWLKGYNDRIAQFQVNETGSCYLPDGTCLHSTSDSILYSAVAIAIFLLIIGSYLMVRREPILSAPHKHKKSPEKAATNKKNAGIQRTLNPETRQVYDIISASNGAILQGEIVAKSGMDKVKVSRILDKLEMQGLIERRRHGMSNLVLLKKG